MTYTLLRTYARPGKLLFFSLCGVCLFAPRGEQWHYAAMVLLALLTASVNIAWQLKGEDEAAIVLITTAKVILSAVFEIFCLWTLFHLSGGKLGWTDFMTLIYFVLFVAPLTLLFWYVLSRSPEQALAKGGLL